MALLAKFSDAMSSMDVNCVVCGHGGASTAWRGVDASTRTRLDTEGPPLARAAVFRTRSACLAPLLLGDELAHLAVDLLEGLKPRMGFNHSSHPVVAASVKQERVGAQREHYGECATNG